MVFIYRYLIVNALLIHYRTFGFALGIEAFVGALPAHPTLLFAAPPSQREGFFRTLYKASQNFARLWDKSE